MAIVAVAGGTGNIGRAIVEALVATGKHEVKILARKPNPEVEAQVGVPVIAVDYDDVPGLTKILEDNKIDTVISTITMIPMDGSSPKEIQLIQAADASKTTKRLISSDWAAPAPSDNVGSLPSVINRLAAEKELAKVSNLETTHIVNGYFLDFFTSPVVKSYLQQRTFFIDIPNNVAAIPGSGDVPVVFTHSADIAKFAAAILDLEKWDPVSYVIGDRVTLNEFLRYAEAAKGVKFDVTHDSVETLKTGVVTELPSYLPMYPFFPKPAMLGFLATFGQWFEAGVFDIKPERTLNDQFPHIKTGKVKDLLEQAWKTT
ncbi:hypothetical protein B0T24DRAFT_718815 [Lasiosphaeria ovina]|uniref:NmrA-like domain-containing protein n=1 Tax=Lasiosphaeria ovina TaxID=92902 RepID=A0AAE0KGQ5_9PEZI|nr:hypothetical protein B0T24DRAFT_718815 [Lasiosphaeria ovina]